MPDRFTLLLAPADEAAALREMFTLAPQLLEDEEDYCSALPVILLEDEWASFTPPAELDPAWAELRHRIRLADYRAQEGLLQGHLQRHGYPDDLASLISAWHPAASRHFYSALYRGGTVLLPEGDILVCVDQQAP